MKDYIEVRNHDMKQIEGQLYTLVEALGITDEQCNGAKGTVRTLLWNWHDNIYNSIINKPVEVDSEIE